jgi:NADH-quinone oxidoreductase subunit L
MFRLMFMTFSGEYRGGGVESAHRRDDHAGHVDTRAGAHAPHSHGGVHESPWVMLGPLVILAILSVCGGWIGANRFEHFLSPATGTVGTAVESASAETATVPAAPAEEHGSEGLLTGISVTAGLLGLFLAWLLYKQSPGLPDRIADSIHSLYSAVANKYWIDELYAAIFVTPLIAISRVVFWRTVDQGLIDGTLNGGAESARELSDDVRHMQSGNLRSYAGWIAIGAAAVIAYMVWVGTK